MQFTDIEAIEEFYRRKNGTTTKVTLLTDIDLMVWNRENWDYFTFDTEKEVYETIVNDR